MTSRYALLFAICLASCGVQTIEEHPCPEEGTELTYGNFGAEFVGNWCQRCHGTAGSARQGAPSAYDFATPAAIRDTRDRIFLRAANENTSMPPGPDDPPLDAREKLADWLACGAPE